MVLGRAVHILAARRIDRSDARDEALAVGAPRLRFDPRLGLPLLRLAQEADLPDEAVAVRLVEDELVLSLVGVLLQAAVTVRHRLPARVAPQVDLPGDP